MTHTINKEDYFELWAEVSLIPKIIETEEEYNLYHAVAERLIAKKTRAAKLTSAARRK